MDLSIKNLKKMYLNGQMGVNDENMEELNKIFNVINLNNGKVYNFEAENITYLKAILTNILEFQNSNMEYTFERGIIFAIFTILFLGLSSISITNLITIMTALFFGVYVSLLYSAYSIVFLLFVLYIAYHNMLYNKLIIAIFTISILVNYYLYYIFGFLDSLIMYSLCIGGMLTIIAYIYLKYRLIAKEKKLTCKMISTIFKLNLPIEDSIKYNMSICREYAKITAMLLNKAGFNDIYYFVILGHVATGLKLNGKYYVLDQRLPILSLNDWLYKVGRKQVDAYSLKFLEKNNSNESKNNETTLKITLEDIKTIYRDYDHNKNLYGELDYIEISKKLLNLLNCHPKPILNKKPDFSISLKYYIREIDDIIEYSILRMLYLAVEKKFGSNISKISNIEIIKSKDVKNELVINIWINNKN
ncbi:transglutaminase-like domain-containing protein [Methanococcus voltae]|uniref:Transglutaminase-like domain-containing protein n=1 Tax=Methanococcus voltae (strain ATCC BAA-1334 / A3) TaxID=456320 RepID=D7DTB1_METV3|nr:transglutaminase-like domain-containing protein [Methanococcus voltae]MCS3901222.1 putative transglutaminase-like protease [Methanococcus voltae]